MSDFNETVVIQHSVAGALTVAAGAVGYVLPFPADLVSVTATVGTAPTGAAILVDVNRNGTTVFTDQDDRPTIAISATSSGVVKNEPALPAGTNYIYTPYPTAVPLGAFAEGDKVTVDVDQIGSGTAGSNLGVVLTFAKK